MLSCDRSDVFGGISFYRKSLAILGAQHSVGGCIEINPLSINRHNNDKLGAGVLFVRDKFGVKLAHERANQPHSETI